MMRRELLLLLACAAFAGCVSVPDQMPVLLERQDPMYPLEALQQGKSGLARVEFIVEADGSVSHPNVVSATRADFGIAASACVKKWKFKPGVKNGKTVRTQMQQSFSFEPSSK